MKKATIKDVAKEAGVSIATVSNALNNADIVLPKTREHVLAVAERLSYIPNANGKRLRAKETRSIGLFVTSMTGDYYGALADAMNYACRRHGYELHIVIVANDESLLNKLMDRSVDGAVIIFGHMERELRRRVVGTGCPIVFLDQEETARHVSSVLFESFREGEMAAEYLLGLGHRDLMHVFGLSGNYDSEERYRGFLTALEKAGVPFKPENLLEGRFEREAAYREMKRYLSEFGRPPEAIFASNDLSAIGCMDALAEVDLRIPEDVSLIGCDNIHLGEFVTPALTTIRTNYPAQGMQAVEELMLLIGQEREGRITKLPGNVIVRRSCQARSENIT